MIKAKQHVVPTQTGTWAVRRSGSSRASRIFTMRLDALQYARGIARREGADLYEHRSDGTIKHWESYSLDIRPAGER